MAWIIDASGLAEWITAAVQYVVLGMLGVLKTFYTWVYGLFTGAIEGVYSGVGTWLPEGWILPDYSSIQVYLDIANRWWPLDYCIVLITLYYTLYGIVRTARATMNLLKAIPH